MDHSYPLTRIITIFLDRTPGKPIAPHIREFMRYVLSRDAQRAVLEKGGGYLPILAPEAAGEVRKLESSVPASAASRAPRSSARTSPRS